MLLHGVSGLLATSGDFFLLIWSKNNVNKAIERAENRDAKDLKRKAKLAKQSQVLDTIPATPDATPGNSPGNSRRPSAEAGGAAVTDTTLVDVTLSNDQKQTVGRSGRIKVKMMKWLPFGAKEEKIQAENEVEFKPTFRDLNPLPSMALILKQPTNLLILTSSGERPSLFISTQSLVKLLTVMDRSR